MAEDKNKEILEKLENGIKEAMNSERYKAFLKLQSNFHAYSFNNAMLIYLQKPNATMVLGYKSWNKLDRHVMKGEKGISILAPNPYKFEKLVDKIDSTTNKPMRDPKTGEIIQQKVELTGMSFKKVTVFDVSQTDGKELPSICNELKGNSISAENIIKAIKGISEIPIVEKNIESGAKGYYSRLENIIALNKGMSIDQTAKTLVHEYAHSQLHNTDDAALLSRATKEVQAESVAYIVSNHLGLDTSEYSFDYLANWSSGKDLKELKESFNLIQKTADAFIEKIESTLSNEVQLQNNINKIDSLEDIKSKVIDQYIKEFPSIKHISDNTAKIIDTLNVDKGQVLTVKEIKKLYKETGKRLEVDNNKSDIQEFKLLKDVVDDFKKSQLTEKQIKSQEKATDQLSKSKAFEMV